ncbi:adenylyl-sulfate kinase [Luteolibacter algae]|uniref:Adenylyl-sulfate kinase n=1 Tax=Luteolibacter algae TaxID=454151 RepID=A0ABW5D474_9BACT
MNIHTEFHRFLNRHDKESLLKQKGLAIWMCGLSGSGKSTIANAAERVLHQQGHFTIILDGDNLRSGLNSNLGFSDEDRLENIRRFAELTKILVNNGVIVFISAITPRGELRDLARGIVGEENLFEVYVKASYEACEQRDVKGLYAKAAKGEIPNFTGQASSFEEPQNPDLTLDTEALSVEDAAIELVEGILPRISTL